MNYDHAINIIKNWERVQRLRNNKWDKPDHSASSYGLDSLNDPTFFRLAPAKKFVPLTRDDLPVSFVVRMSDCDSVQTIAHSTTSDSVYVGTRNMHLSYLFSHPDIQYSTDRKTWHQFRKEVVG